MSTPNEPQARLVVQRLYEYDNFRTFLRDYFEEQKRLKKHFSHRFFAQKAGFSSSGFCSQLIKGERNLTIAATHKLVEALGLAGKAALFFENLVHFNQAKSVQDREKFLQEMKRLRRRTDFYRLNRRQFDYYEEWYYPVIRELAVYADWKDHAGLGRLVEPPIPADKARQAVERLEEIGLLVRGKDGRYRQNAPALSTHDIPRTLLRERKKEMIWRGLDAYERMPQDQWHVSGVTVAISESAFREIGRKLDEIRQEILANAVEDRVDRVYRINFEAFPLSRALPAEAPGSEEAG